MLLPLTLIIQSGGVVFDHKARFLADRPAQVVPEISPALFQEPSSLLDREPRTDKLYEKLNPPARRAQVAGLVPGVEHGIGNPVSGWTALAFSFPDNEPAVFQSAKLHCDNVQRQTRQSRDLVGGCRAAKPDEGIQRLALLPRHVVQHMFQQRRQPADRLAQRLHNRNHLAVAKHVV